jgi:beta-barrel assembly-enhancing protease
MSYGREDEIESDARAMIRVMEVLAKASGGSTQPEFMSTHRAPENRAEIAKRFPQGVPKGLGE